MTKDEAMKLALEALELINIEFVCGNGSHHKKEDRHEWDEDCPITNRWRKAIIAIKEALAQPEQEPIVHDPLPRACNLAGVDYQTFLKIKAYMPVAPPQPERHELQAKGEHPAPCARHCEANAFQIVIKNLKAQLAQKEQEPVAWGNFKEDGTLVGLSQHPEDQANWAGRKPLYTHPPQRTWVDVPDEEIKRLWIQYRAALPRYLCFAKALLARSKEKNT